MSAQNTYICTVCNRSYGRKDLLKNHNSRYHKSADITDEEFDILLEYAMNHKADGSGPGFFRCKCGNKRAKKRDMAASIKSHGVACAQTRNAAANKFKEHLKRPYGETSLQIHKRLARKLLDKRDSNDKNSDHCADLPADGTFTGQQVAITEQERSDEQTEAANDRRSEGGYTASLGDSTAPLRDYTASLAREDLENRVRCYERYFKRNEIDSMLVLAGDGHHPSPPFKKVDYPQILEDYRERTYDNGKDAENRVRCYECYFGRNGINPIGVLADDGHHPVFNKLEYPVILENIGGRTHGTGEDASAYAIGDV